MWCCILFIKIELAEDVLCDEHKYSSAHSATLQLLW